MTYVNLNEGPFKGPSLFAVAKNQKLAVRGESDKNHAKALRAEAGYAVLVQIDACLIFCQHVYTPFLVGNVMIRVASICCALLVIYSVQLQAMSDEQKTGLRKRLQEAQTSDEMCELIKEHLEDGMLFVLDVEEIEFLQPNLPKDHPNTTY